MKHSFILLVFLTTSVFCVFAQKPLKPAYCNKERSGALPGQIIHDPNFPNKMVYNKDDNHDGQLDPFFLCGPGEPEGFLYRGTRNTDGTRNGDQLELIRKLKKNGGNSIYIIAVRSHGGDAWKDKRDNPEIYPDDLHNPWLEQDTKAGLNEKMLDQWETWFAEMDKNNIIIYFFIYDDAIDVAKQFGWSLEDQGNLNPEEKKFVQTMVRRFKHHKNLIWCVMEEGQEIGRDWRQHISKIAEAISEADDHHHIIASHQLGGNVFFHKGDPVINQFAIQTDKDKVGTSDDLHRWLLSASEDSQGNYSAVMSEDWVQGSRSVPNGDRGEVRQRNWAAAMAGSYIMVLGMDIANTPDAWLNDCKVMQTFFEATTFNQMHPNDLLAHGESMYVLANKGYDYILYSANTGDNLGVKAFPRGNYSLKWLDCIDGRTEITENVSFEAGDHIWAKPAGFGPEIALYIYNEHSRPETLKNPDTKLPFDKEKKPVNTVPVAKSYVMEVVRNTPKDIQLRYEDIDGGPGPYSVEIISKPNHGTLSGIGNDKIYTPGRNYVGEDWFSWKVNDGKNDSEVVTITITVHK